MSRFEENGYTGGWYAIGVGDQPGDEAAQGMPGASENICPNCQGSGKNSEGADCEFCGGDGRVVEGIGGG